MDKDTFVSGYCERSNLTLEQFDVLYDVYPCIEVDEGWQVVEKGKEPLLATE